MVIMSDEWCREPEYKDYSFEPCTHPRSELVEEHEDGEFRRCQDCGREYGVTNQF